MNLPSRHSITSSASNCIVLGTVSPSAFAQLEKARLVAKLKAARDRKREATGKCEGRKGYAEGMPETVALAKELHAQGLSYRKISAELAAQGHVTRTGKAHVASAVQKMLEVC